MVGQLASPLQALWITAQVAVWADMLFLRQTTVHPEQLLVDFKTLLLQQRSDHWLLPTMQADGVIYIAHGGQVMPLPAKGPVQVQHLLNAERRLQPAGVSLSVSVGDRLLAADAWLHFQSPEHPYQLQVWPKRQARAQAPEQVVLAVCDGQGCHVQVGTTGTFLFEHCPRPNEPCEISCQVAGVARMTGNRPPQPWTYEPCTRFKVRPEPPLTFRSVESSSSWWRNPAPTMWMSFRR